MAKKMLIDAGHPEETRVVILNGNRVEEFDFEVASKKQLKGNIYLAKVTRVEPSLQAAFVEYGGNRHGFLAFSEIHPDYYQIPVADRQALLEEEAAAEREADIEEDEEANSGVADNEADADDSDGPADSEAGTTDAADADEDDSSGEEGTTPLAAEADAAATLAAELPESGDGAAEDGDGGADDDASLARSRENSIDEVADPNAQARPEEVGAQDAMEEVTRKRRRLMRRYKIQEVIKRRQIILVQVVKEERGNKGAALTTYLSMAGRYCVLMPNTDRGGGISRKITQANDRKRLKEIANDLEVPEGMGVIIRTAGANRTKAELKRDYEYLLRLWESVRELTLKSVAPKLVYEEGNLVKRSIRDLYGRDIDTVLVEGDEAYKEAKSFMRMLTPSHAKNVQPYKDRIALFQRYQIDSQLDGLYTPTVELKSGGYIVINPTEALVSIDVNSGRSTKEHSIEETALKTNLEAAEEISRQLRLRDLAGLIVIDFIDMEEHRNNRQVERRLKDCLKVDRARIQVGRISAFGLLEMSRQRLRSSVLENSTLICEHCEGTGRVPSVESAALRILRAIEEEGVRGRMEGIQITTTTEVALYLLNHKREVLREIEYRLNLPCFVNASPHLISGNYELERAADELVAQRRAIRLMSPQAEGAITADTEVEDLSDFDFEDEEEEIVEASAETETESEAETSGDDDRNGKRRRRRRRRGGRRDRADEASAAGDNGDEAAPDDGAGEEEETDEDGSEEAAAARAEDGDEDGLNEDGTPKRRRRRGRRGGRRNRRNRDGSEITAESGSETDGDRNDAQDDEDDTPSQVRTIEITTVDHEETALSAPAEPEAEEQPAPAPERAAAPPDEPATAETVPQAEPVMAEPEPAMASEPADAEPPQNTGPTKKGWWQRSLFG